MSVVRGVDEGIGADVSGVGSVGKGLVLGPVDEDSVVRLGDDERRISLGATSCRSGPRRDEHTPVGADCDVSCHARPWSIVLQQPLPASVRSICGHRIPLETCDCVTHIV